MAHLRMVGLDLQLLGHHRKYFVWILYTPTMGNLKSCISNQGEKDAIGLMQTLLEDMEKRIMECIKAELTQAGVSRSSGNITPPEIPEPPKLIRQDGANISYIE